MGNLCTKVPEQAIAQSTLTTTNHTRTQQALGVSYTEIEEFKEERMRVAGGNAETELTERLPQTPNQGPFRLNQERQALTDTQANKDREGDEKEVEIMLIKTDLGKRKLMAHLHKTKTRCFCIKLAGLMKT